MVNATVITDPKGKILFFSHAFGELTGLKPSEQIGKQCLDIIPASRMHLVGKTGIPEINDIQLLNGKERVVQRIPLRKNNKVIGVVSQVVFKDKEEVVSLVRRLKLMKKKMKLYENTMASYHNTRYGLESYVGDSQATQEIKQKAQRAAKTNLPVLILGESGTGKEVLAQAIHGISSRANHPFIRINYANIPKELLESELFGYEAGAFTGARADGHMGKFEMANKGTIFLDEIGEMPPDMQAKLLSVLEEKSFYRVGGNSLVHVDFRVISATNQDLGRCMEEGRFRKDLFYRLSTVSITIPPLRERPDDIEPITQEILRRSTKGYADAHVRLSSDAKKLMRAYSWPGNARELVNCIECALAFCDGDVIEPAHLSITGESVFVDQSEADKYTLKKNKLKTERETILTALETCRWCKTDAAKMLGIHRSLLYRKLAELNLMGRSLRKKK